MVAAWVWTLKNWRLVLGGALVLVVIAGWAYVTHLQHLAKARKAQLQTAAQQVWIQEATTQAVDKVATKTQAVEEKTHVIVRRIQAAPGADAPIPADVLSAWRSGLRDESAEPSR